MTAPFGSGEWAGSGECTIPTQNFTPADWLVPDGPYGVMGVLYANFDLGDKPCELDQTTSGTSMAFREVLFEEYGVFEPIWARARPVRSG